MATCCIPGHFLKIQHSLKWKCFVVLLLLPFCSPGQSTTNISGIVNSYYSVTEVIYASSCVRVDNSAGLSSGDKVLIIQMKGAAINTANNSSFGDTTSLNEAGNYEVATICSIGSDSVFLFHTLLNTYSVSDQVQLVKFAEYYSADVMDTVKAMGWDNTTGKGGVIAISVEQDLVLHAPIFADTLGYLGGKFLMSNSTCNSFYSGYAYNGNSTSPQGGALKGEGVANVAAGSSGGRGAPANGGGGGNNHNNGGGGGANLSAAGAGGGNYTTVSGACTGNYKGLGGKALSSYGGTKIFPGGGGGAGHVNNNAPTHGGGNGGGIIFILGRNIIGNGFSITASGGVGGNSGSDGASGGGAGGTIIMHVLNNYTGPLSITADGGGGGTANNQNILNRCYGAGGGGSGGAIYFNTALPAITSSVTGGAAGSDVGVSGCGTPVPAGSGQNGFIITNYSYRTSTNVSNSCALALPINLVSFTATLKKPDVSLAWVIANPLALDHVELQRKKEGEDWQPIQKISTIPQSNDYQTEDLHPGYGNFYYRLLIVEKNGERAYSAIRNIKIAPINTVQVFPNPARDRIHISGQFHKNEIISITDIEGRVIVREKITEDKSLLTLDISRFKRGIYILQNDAGCYKLVIR